MHYALHLGQTFQRIPKDERRFRIDPRFKTVLTDDRFRAIDGRCMRACEPACDVITAGVEVVPCKSMQKGHSSREIVELEMGFSN